MKDILTKIFVTLGGLFLVVIVITTSLFFADAYGIKTLVLGSPAPIAQVSKTNVPSSVVAEADEDVVSGEAVATGGFVLSSAQVDALVSLGINPADVPTSISAEQEACFVEALGKSRVGEIKAGAVPNALEFLGAKTCIR